MFPTLSQLAAQWILPVLAFWLILCVFAATVQEWLAGTINARGRALHLAIRNMLGDSELTQKLYDHPMIRTVRVKPLGQWRIRTYNYRRPERLNAKLFAQVILDWVVKPVPSASPEKKPTTQTQPRKSEPIHPIKTITQSQLRKDVQSLRRKYPQLAKVLGVLLSGCDKDGAEPDEPLICFQAHIEDWFNSVMEETSRQYKRSVRRTLLVIGLLLAVYVNFDPISLTTQLWNDPQSQQAAPANGISHGSTSFSIGWTIYVGELANCQLFPDSDQLFGFRFNDRCLSPLSGARGTDIVFKLLGFVSGSILISIGSQYIFDLLKKKIAA